MTSAHTTATLSRAPQLILALAALLVLLVAPSRLRAQQGVSIEVVPANVQLSASLPAQARVVLRNASATPLRDITLSSFTNIDARVEPETVQLAELGAGSEYVWPITITITGTQLVGNIYLRADYTTQPEPPAQPSTHSVFGSLEIGTQLVDQVADVAVQSDLSALTEQNPGKVYLLITNKTNAPIVLTRIAPRPNDFVTFEPASTADAATIAPYGSYAANFTVKTTSVVLPGKQVLLFDLEIEQAGYTRQLVATHAVDVGVFGDQVIRTALALPSLFVLPGFLAIVTVALLWGWRKTKEQRAEFRFQVNTAEFWMAAITISLIGALLYPYATQWTINERRNYILGAYGLFDVVAVWFASIGLAAIGYGSVRLILNGLAARAARLEREAQARQQAELAARTFALSDTPLDVLRKLVKNGRSLYRRTVRVGQESGSAYLLDDELPAQGNAWVTPPIRIIWLDPARVDGLPEKIDAELGKPPQTLDGAACVSLLQEGTSSGALRLEWVPLDKLPRSQQVPVAQVKQAGSQPQLMLQQ